MDQQAEKYWHDLSVDDRCKLLEEYCFWSGFSQYLWEYLPDTLKTLIAFKIDCNTL